MGAAAYSAAGSVLLGFCFSTSATLKEGLDIDIYGYVYGEENHYNLAG